MAPRASRALPSILDANVGRFVTSEDGHAPPSHARAPLCIGCQLTHFCDLELAWDPKSPSRGRSPRLSPLLRPMQSQPLRDTQRSALRPAEPPPLRPAFLPALRARQRAPQRPRLPAPQRCTQRLGLRATFRGRLRPKQPAARRTTQRATPRSPQRPTLPVPLRALSRATFPSSVLFLSPRCTLVDP